jgi:hypothetical protein
VAACAQLKTALTELSERAKHKAVGQHEQVRGGQRPRARAKQPAALITNSRCKMFASPSRGDLLEGSGATIQHSKILVRVSGHASSVEETATCTGIAFQRPV